MENPNCYKCKYRKTLAGSVHSQCTHPKTQKALESNLGAILSLFASVGRTNPIVEPNSTKELNMKFNNHGVRKGWCNWPWNFDPVWVKNCDGFVKEK